MTRIIKDIEAHYEVHEAPFSRSYEWHPASVTLVCDCGERFTLTATSTTTTCRCGTDHGDIVRNIQMHEDRLPNKTIHPWHHDAQEQEEQHQQDEVTYPKGSPWRYNDVTSGTTNVE